MSELDDLGDDFAARVQSRNGRPRANFGSIGRTNIRCAGMGGEICNRARVIKGGRLWYCRGHAPRGCE